MVNIILTEKKMSQYMAILVELNTQEIKDIVHQKIKQLSQDQQKIKNKISIYFLQLK